jgi:hypothetical protein
VKYGSGAVNACWAALREKTGVFLAVMLLGGLLLLPIVLLALNLAAFPWTAARRSGLPYSCFAHTFR